MKGVRKHVSWASLCLLAVLIRGRAPRPTLPRGVLLRACRIPIQNLGKERGGKRLVTLTHLNGWQTYRFERFGEGDIRRAYALGLIAITPNEHAEPKPDAIAFSWGKRAAIRVEVTELGRAQFASHLLQGGVIPFEERGL